MRIPDIDFRLETERMIIEPVCEAHAGLMVNVISDPELYRYIPLDPPTLEMLSARYKRWETLLSPDESEIRLNWVARLKTDDTYIGDFQVGYDENGKAYIAYMVAKSYQGQGYAFEGLVSVLDLLFKRLDIHFVKAWIDTRNEASIRLVKRVGMTQVGFISKADYFKNAASDEYVFEITSIAYPYDK